jgi:hypothetical protein
MFLGKFGPLYSYLVISLKFITLTWSILLQLWFRWPDDKENAARRVVRNVVKLIPQMFYEGHFQSVITYYNRVLGRKIKRAEACQTDLTKQEYMQVMCCPLILVLATG